MWWRRRPDDSPASQPASPQGALEERLSAYLDDEVSADERVEVETLLEADASAREHLDDLRLLTSALASLGEVRAPRSFAIPASAGSSARSGLGAPAFRANGGVSVLSFRRMEWAVRASAAAAALLFVFALASDLGGSGSATTGVPGLAMQAEADAPAASFAAPEARTAGDEGPQDADALTDDGEVAPGGAALLPAGTPAPPVGGGADSEDSQSSDGAGEDGGGMGTMSVPGEELRAPEDAEGDSGKRADLTQETGAYQAPEPGTFGPAPASQGVGGVAAALATLALLLTGMSVLLARTREAGPADHR